MILEFSVSNFRSFKDLQTLSMVSQPLKHKFYWLDKNTFETENNLKLLKSKAVFGPNASGKSNLIKALGAFGRIVNESVKDDRILDDVIEPFILSSESIDLPSFFQLIFVVEGVQYRYGFEASNREIKNEWLFGKPEKNEVFYFIREGDDIKHNKNKFPEGGKLGFLLNEDNQIVRPNALFLSAAASLNGIISKKLFTAISKIIIISGIDDSFMKNIAFSSMENSVERNKVIHFLNESGIDIEGLSFEEFGAEQFTSSVPKEVQEILKRGKKVKMLTSIHTQYGKNRKPLGQISWDFDTHESDGTKKMLQLSTFIIASLEQGRPLILDEFESRLHTALSKSIVQLYNSNSGNPNNAQFIFSTHDTNLLSSKLMRRDQICFTQKNEFGESKVYSLADIKGVRNDESYEKNYLIGKYDALPNIGDLDLPLVQTN